MKSFINSSFRKLENELFLREEIAELLEWDQQVCMPSGAADGRAAQQALLAESAHTLAISPAYEDALRQAQETVQTLDLSEADQFFLQQEVALAIQSFERRKKIPPEFVARQAHAGSNGMMAWSAARSENDFSIFAPHLEKLVALAREESAFLSSGSHVLDPLLENYAPGFNCQLISNLFQQTGDRLCAILQEAVQKSSQTTPLRGSFSKEKQLAISNRLMKTLSLPEQFCRLDCSEHPFTCSPGRQEARITTRVCEKDLSCIWSVLHEGGHARYDLAARRAFPDSRLGRLNDLVLHESQSRTWENLLGRHPAFLEYLYGLCREYFSAEDLGKNAETFASKVNFVSPGAIRVDADEVAYNLHIMLRFELEKGMLSNEIPIRELPEIWKEKMQRYLNVSIASDVEGVLQDIHWADGSFGYFPSYALGNFAGAQLFEELQRVTPNLEEQLRMGDLTQAGNWLEENVYLWGRTFTAPELVQKVTKSPLSPEAFLNYLTGKYCQS